MLPIGCPKAPIGSSVFIQDVFERNRSDLKGGVGLREGEWWEK